MPACEKPRVRRVVGFCNSFAESSLDAKPFGDLDQLAVPRVVVLGRFVDKLPADPRVLQQFSILKKMSDGFVAKDTN